MSWRAGTMPPQIFGSSGSTLPSRSFCAAACAGTLGQRLGQAREIREQVVEAAVLEVDHDHVLDVFLELGVERALAGLARLRDGRRRFAGGRQRGRQADRGGGLEDLAARRIGGLAGFRQLLVVMRVLHGLLLDGRRTGR
jgi:hypothetical protein